MKNCAWAKHMITMITLTVSSINGDRSQRDCQSNENFILCGHCEGTCKEPVIASCRAGCLPPRCECETKNGFVRAHDGACIHVSECAVYHGLYFSRAGPVMAASAPKFASSDNTDAMIPLQSSAPLTPTVLPQMIQSDTWSAVADQKPAEIDQRPAALSNSPQREMEVGDNSPLNANVNSNANSYANAPPAMTYSKFELEQHTLPEYDGSFGTDKGQYSSNPASYQQSHQQQQYQPQPQLQQPKQLEQQQPMESYKTVNTVVPSPYKKYGGKKAFSDSLGSEKIFSPGTKYSRNNQVQQPNSKKGALATRFKVQQQQQFQQQQQQRQQQLESIVAAYNPQLITIKEQQKQPNNVNNLTEAVNQLNNRKIYEGNTGNYNYKYNDNEKFQSNNYRASNLKNEDTTDEIQTSTNRYYGSRLRSQKNSETNGGESDDQPSDQYQLLKEQPTKQQDENSEQREIVRHRLHTSVPADDSSVSAISASNPAYFNFDVRSPYQREQYKPQPQHQQQEQQQQQQQQQQQLQQLQQLQQQQQQLQQQQQQLQQQQQQQEQIPLNRQQQRDENISKQQKSSVALNNQENLQNYYDDQQSYNSKPAAEPLMSTNLKNELSFNGRSYGTKAMPISGAGIQIPQQISTQNLQEDKISMPSVIKTKKLDAVEASARKCKTRECANVAATAAAVATFDAAAISNKSENRFAYALVNGAAKVAKNRPRQNAKNFAPFFPLNSQEVRILRN